MVLTREQILGQVDAPLKTERVQVPEWGGEVIIREWTGTERDEFENSFVNDEGKRDLDATQNVRAKIVARSVVDEKGHLQFTPADVEQLGQLSAKALNRVFMRARDLIGMSDKDVKELEKN